MSIYDQAIDGCNDECSLLSEEEEEEAETKVGGANGDGGENSEFTTMADDSVENKETPHHESRGGVWREPSNYSVASTSSVAYPLLSGGEHSATRSKFQSNRVEGVSEDTHDPTGHHLVRSIQWDSVGILTAFCNP